MPAPPDTLLRSRLAAFGYDALNRAIWLPTGTTRLRRQFVAALGIEPGARVLELGCGTGTVTRWLLAAGASVVAVDGSAPMLERARRHAPGATYVQANLLDPAAYGHAPVDHVVLALVLHELDPEGRIAVLRAAAETLQPSGTVGVLEWAVPKASVPGRVWRAMVRAIEPAVAHDIVDRGLDAALETASLPIVLDRPAAGGRARIVVAGPAPSSSDSERRACHAVEREPNGILSEHL